MIIIAAKNVTNLLQFACWYLSGMQKIYGKYLFRYFELSKSKNSKKFIMECNGISLYNVRSLCWIMSNVCRSPLTQLSLSSSSGFYFCVLMPFLLLIDLTAVCQWLVCIYVVSRHGSHGLLHVA